MNICYGNPSLQAINILGLNYVILDISSSEYMLICVFMIYFNTDVRTYIYVDTQIFPQSCSIGYCP